MVSQSRQKLLSLIKIFGGKNLAPMWSVKQLKTKECHMWQPYVFQSDITCISVRVLSLIETSRLVLLCCIFITIKKPFQSIVLSFLPSLKRNFKNLFPFLATFGTG